MNQAAPVSEAEARERVEFVLKMRLRGLADLRVLRALERTPRSFFVPQRYSDIAARDIALPIGGGQTAPPPSTVAAMIEALKLTPEHRVLEIGAGSGYAAALIAQIAREVVSLERSQTLALESAGRLAAFGLRNVKVSHADGLGSDSVEGTFDRVIVHALIEPPAPRLTRWLNVGGLLVGAVAEEGGQRVARLTLAESGEIRTETLGPVRTLAPLVVGLMRAL